MMDLAVKKIELIKWITTQNEETIMKIENIRTSSLEKAYYDRMNEDLGAKINRSEAEVEKGNTRKQKDVESFFNSKFGH